MADKSPPHPMPEKYGTSLEEKRLDEEAKADPASRTDPLAPGAKR